MPSKSAKSRRSIALPAPLAAELRAHREAQAEADGWYLVGQRGSHRQYRHQTKKGRVTIPGRPSWEMYPELSILRQAGLMGGDQ